MKVERTESFRRWATLIVSALALLVACLRDPIVMTLKSTVREVIRDEMDRYEIVPRVVARQQEKGRDAEIELLKHLDQEVAALRDLTSRSEMEHNTWQQVSNCLMTVEAKLDQFSKESQRNLKQQSSEN